MFCTVGTHPHNAAAEPDVPAEEIAALSRHPRCIAIGEAGLDYFYDRSPRAVQQRVFRTHIAAARHTGLPLVIHARDADDDMIRILTEEMGQGSYKAVLHCFSSGAELARVGVRARLRGVILRHPDLQEIRRAPQDRGGRAARPAPRRDGCALSRAGAASRPLQRAGLCRPHGAGARRDGGVSEAEIARITTANFYRLFAKAAAADGARRRRPRDAAGADPGLRLLRRRAAGRGRLGRLRPGEPEEPPPPLLGSRRAGGAAGTTSVLIDTSPDLREQLLDAEVRRLDAVLFTHEHADHTHGIDDLRPLVIAMRRRMPVYMDRVTGELLMSRFAYCFETPPGSQYPPILSRTDGARPAGQPRGARRRAPGAAVPDGARRHRRPRLPLRRSGLCAGRERMPDESLGWLEGLDILILDALRDTPHPTHFSVAEALAVIERVRPRRAILTNLHTDLDYGRLVRELPPGVEPAYDGLTVEVQVPAEPALIS